MYNYFAKFANWREKYEKQKQQCILGCVSSAHDISNHTKMADWGKKAIYLNEKNWISTSMSLLISLIFILNFQQMTIVSSQLVWTINLTRISGKERTKMTKELRCVEVQRETKC